MYKMIVDMLEDDLSVQEIAGKLNIPVRQVTAIEADLYELV
jgi:hypothetical protein